MISDRLHEEYNGLVSLLQTVTEHSRCASLKLSSSHFCLVGRSSAKLEKKGQRNSPEFLGLIQVPTRRVQTGVRWACQMCPGWNRTLSFLLLFQPQTRASLSLLHFDKLDRILSAVLAKNRGSSFLSPFVFSSLINPFYFISQNVHRSLSALRMYSYTPLSGQGSVARRRGAADGRGRVRVSLSLCVTDALHSARCQAHAHSSPV